MHPALLQSSGWRYKGRYREMEAAVRAGCAATWDELPKHRKIDILAWYEISWRIEAVNSWEAAHKNRRKRA